MRVSKDVKRRFKERPELWVQMVHDTGFNYFYFLCPTHMNLVHRESDCSGRNTDESAVCDYPACESMNVREYFPNLTTRLKESLADIKAVKKHGKAKK